MVYKMKYKINNVEYDVIIEKKNNKNTYIRVKEDLKIYVSTNFFTTKKQVIKILDQNEKSLIKMINTQIKRNEKNMKFFYLGNSYDIIIVHTMKDIDIDVNNNIIYAPSMEKLNKWLKKEIEKIFYNKYQDCFENFNEGIECPKLKIRTMKSRWGVYNRKNHSITLNSHLIEYSLEKLEYVIYHELSHTIHFDHSKSFWNLVDNYCSNYKQIQKELKE